MRLYLKAERPILVDKTNKQETQILTKTLYSLTPIYCKYILTAETHQGKIDRYVEALLEQQPDEYEVVYDWLDAAHGVKKPKYSPALLQVHESIVKWINQVLEDGYRVTWHNE